MTILDVMQMKNKSGAIESPTWQVPAELKGEYIVSLVMPLSDLQDKDNHVEVMSQISKDGGLTWQNFVGFKWDGGPNSYIDKDGNILSGPGFGISAEKIAGKLMKVKIKLSKPVRIGAQIESI